MRALRHQRHLAEKVAFVKVCNRLTALLDDHLPLFDQVERLAGCALVEDRGAAGIVLDLKQVADCLSLDASAAKQIAEQWPFAKAIAPIEYANQHFMAGAIVQC